MNRQRNVLGYIDSDGRIHAPEDIKIVYKDVRCRWRLAGRLKDTWADRQCVLPAGHAGSCRVIHQCKSEPDVYERIAERFHTEYEDGAPSYGYETRKASAVPWKDVPDDNKALMIATVQGLCMQGIIEPGPYA